MLAATASVPRTVQELVDHCGVPTATAYRKVDELAEIGLLTSRVRVKAGGRNANEYRLCVDAIEVTFRDDTEPRVTVSPSVHIETNAVGEPARIVVPITGDDAGVDR